MRTSASPRVNSGRSTFTINLHSPHPAWPPLFLLQQQLLVLSLTLRSLFLPHFSRACFAPPPQSTMKYNFHDPRLVRLISSVVTITLPTLLLTRKSRPNFSPVLWSFPPAFGVGSYCHNGSSFFFLCPLNPVSFAIIRRTPEYHLPCRFMTEVVTSGKDMFPFIVIMSLGKVK